MSRIRTNQRKIKDIVKPSRTLRWKQYVLTGFVSLLLLAASISGLYSLNQSLRVEHWQVFAPAPLKADISKTLQSMESLDFWHSRPAYLREILLKGIPDLADIHIQRQLPNSLIIHVTARQAIALWLNSEDSQQNLYLVDGQGIAYLPRQHGERLDLPMLRMSAKHLPQACQWLTALKQEQPAWFARSSELFATYDGWKLNLAAGQQWYIPFGERGLQTIAQLSKILKQPRWHAGNWRVDTRLENRWFLRPATHEGVI